MGEPATMVVGDDGVVFLGWDEDLELAAQELGFEPSPCGVVAQVLKNGVLDEELIFHSKIGDADIVGALIVAGADTNAAEDDGWTALHWAAEGGYADIIKLLINAGADVNSRSVTGWTPLHSAACGGDVVATAVLLEAGADVNAIEDSGDTALGWAETFEETETARLLRRASVASQER